MKMDNFTTTTNNDLGDNSAEEITPIDLYNAIEGKLMASLSWLIAKVYGRNIPDALLDPFYRDDNNVLHLKPGSLYCLTTGELYCAAASTVFHDVGFLNQNHTMILQALKRYGIVVVDADGNHVTETLLNQTAPFKTNAHLAMIDALMTAYVREIINSPRVVKIVKKYANVHPDETPTDTEDALLFWINKICGVVRDNLEKQKDIGQTSMPIIPEMEDLYEDICDGACILTLLSFYANEQLQLNAICFNDPMSFSDCVHNLRLMKQFCEKNFSSSVFHFNYEDILYTHESFQPNINAFIADLFYFFEGVADIKSPTQTMSMTKRHFDRVGIPDLRPLEKENNIRSASNRPNRLSMNMTHTPSLNRETNNNPCGSIGTSLMNSTDSLMTIKSCDSLKYQPCTKSASSSNAGTPSATFADFALAKTLDMQPALRTGQVLNSPDRESALGSSEMRGSNASSDHGKHCHNKPPSWSVRMQLEEKRRQIESQQLLAKSERYKQGQMMSKEAFMKLYGKRSTISGGDGGDRGNGGISEDDEAQLDQQQAPPLSAQPTNQNRQQAQQRPVEIDQISNSIREIKEQMKRLAVEQERMQQKLAASNPAIAVPHQQPQDVRNGTGGFELTDQSFITITSSVSGDVQPITLPNVITWQSTIAANNNNQTFTLDSTSAPSQSTSAEAIYQYQLQQQHYSQLQHVNHSAVDHVTPPQLPMGLANQMTSAAMIGQSSTNDGRPMSPSNLGFIVGDDDRQNEEISRRKELMVASALRRKAMLDKRKDLTEEETARKQDEMMKKEEEEKQRKREKELHRMKIFEEYQRKKAEQLANEQTSSSATTLPRGSSPSTSKPTPTKINRPLSQMVSDKTGTAENRALTSSADNIDQIDVKSQSSDGGGSNSLICEPALKLFVKPSQKSNRNIIYNAIQYCVLAGSVNETKKQKCLQELAKSDNKHFMVLFRDQKCQFRGLYSWDQVSDTVHKMFGLGPSSCSEKFLQALFKYDSGAKQFIEIPAKHFSANTDGFTVLDEFWQKKKPLYAKSATMKS